MKKYLDDILIAFGLILISIATFLISVIAGIYVSGLISLLCGIFIAKFLRG